METTNLFHATLLLALSVPFSHCQGQEANSSSGNPIQASSRFMSTDLFASGKNDVNTYRIPSLITTYKRTLIAVCDARVNKPGDAPNNIDLVMKRSFDNGKTWTEQKTIVDFPGNNAACDASMVVDKQTGVIWLAYDYAVADPQGQLGRIIRIHIIKSSNDGATWSKPVNLNCLTKGKSFWLQNAPGRGLYTKDGVIVFPMYTIKGDFHHPKQKQTVLQTVLIISNDHGKSWSMSNGVGNNNVEAQAASLSNGGIIVNMRRPNGEGYRQIATTSDLGQTWSEVYTDSTLIEPGCQGSIINYQIQGKSFLLFSIPDNKKFRRDLVLHISDNEGKAWQKKISIYKESAAYSCLTKLPNGNIGILYEANAYKRIVFAEIPFQDILIQTK